MFERNESVLERVSLVAKRFRAMRFWWLLALITTIASLAGWALLGQVQSGELPPRQTASILLGITAIAAFVSLLAVRLSYRNPRWIATRIESRFPGLQQRLLTALNQSPASGEQLGYLQQRVLSDAYQHSVTHRWTDAVPRASSIMSRLTGGLSLMVFAFVTCMLFLSAPNNESNARSRAISSPHIVIEPGNAEVERGSGLVISARFPSEKLFLDGLDLVAIDEAATERKFAMSQSLDDPILSAYVPTIDKPFRYKIVSPAWQSEEYSVEVFEFPRLARADADLTYPEYTQLGTKKIGDTVRLSAVEGTTVRWDLLLNKPVPKVVVRDKQGKKVETSQIANQPSPNQPNQVSFEVTLSNTERWTVELEDEKGRTNKYPITLDARAIPNRVPDLKMIRGGDFVASPLEELSLAASAQDDFGIIRAGISYSLATGDAQEIILAESIPRATKQQLDHLVELETLKAEPDQLLSYHFWVEDYAADSEVRRTEGDLYFAEIRPFDEIFREGESPAGGEPQQQQQNGSQQTEELAELQKQIIAATWKVSRSTKSAKQSPTFVDDVKLLQESQQQALDQATELAEAAEDEKTKSLVDKLLDQMQSAVANLREAAARVDTKPLGSALTAEQSAYQTLLQLRAHEFMVSQSRQQRSQKSQGASAQRRQKQLDALELKNDENRYETQSQATDANEDQDGQREERQILNRLKELAQRQEDINKQLAQLQSALEQAKTEEEKEEIRRQLKRLREQEQELLRESDELADRMQQPENSQSMEQEAQQLEQTRENLRRSSEALEKNDAAEALAAGTRAERQFEELSEEFRKRAAGEFDETVREMRTKARELEQTQQELGKQLEQMSADNQPGLRAGGDREAVRQSLTEQQQEFSELLEKVQQTVEEAEPAEPLLAQNLYETFRKTQQNQLDERMTETGNLLRNGFDAEAQQLQRSVQDATAELRKDLEKAAESVLGNEAKALERALSELEKLDQALSSEMAAANPGKPDPNNPNSAATDQNANAEETPPAQSQSNSGKPQQGSQPSEQGQSQSSQQSQAQASQQGQGQQQGQPQSQQSSQGEGRLEQLGGGNRALSSPITGSGFREWTDGLRDVEEIVGDPALRSEAAAIRDRAREMRLELRRHSEEPKWELVEEMIAKPLRELKMKVSEELYKRTSDRTAPVPIDRDPVPDEYSKAVQRYYESLGSGR